jgi:predicted ATPase
MYVRKLDLMNWKNFRTPGPVTFERRLFLVGPNASGKSNLLDVFRFLRALSVPGGGLQQAVSVRGGVSAIRCLAARSAPDITIDVELQDEGDPNGAVVWGYCLVFSQDKSQKPIIKKELVTRNGTEVLSRPDKEDEEDPLRRTQTALEQITANQAFRPIAEFFKSVAYQHLLPQVIRDPNSFSPGPITNDPYGRDFLQRVAKTTVKTREPRLRKILDALRVAVPQLDALHVERDSDGVPHLIGVYAHWRPHGSKQNEAQFSDGTLRLFGILWSLFEGDGPLLMEEPELSLHVELVRILPQMIERVHKYRKKKRQVIISTHSAEMLSDKGIGGEEVLRLEPSDKGTLLKSPTESDDERALLESGLSVGEVVMPKTAPENMEQLLLPFA